MAGDSIEAGIVYFVLLMAGYFLPSLVATSREHHQAGAIFVLNLLLGWTVLGWVIALIWSVSAIRKPSNA